MRNIIVDKKNKLVKIEVNPIFYPKENIEQSCRDYEEICSSEISSLDKKTRITLKPKKPVDLDIIGFEFMNYLLSLSKTGMI